MREPSVNADPGIGRTSSRARIRRIRWVLALFASVFAIAAHAVTFTPATLPNGTVGEPYSQTFSTPDAVGSYSYSIPSGALPIGLSFSSAGVLSGTPTATGTFTFSIQITDSLPSTATQSYTVAIAPPTIAISPAPGALPGVVAGNPYSIAFTASGGIAPRNFSLVSGAIPVGMSLSSGGVFSGTPTVPGNYSFTLRATDGAGFFTQGVYTVAVTAPTITINPDPGAFPGGTVGIAYHQTLTGQGGTAPYSFSLLAGALPIGVSFSSAGVFSGVPRSAGSFSMTIRVTDNNGFTSQDVYTMAIAPPTLVITPAALPAATLGTPYSQSLTTSGGVAPHSYSIVSGSLPVGVSFSSAGVFSGTPFVAGSYTATVRSTDDAGFSTTQSYTIEATAPVVTMAPAAGALPSATAYVPYSQTFTASGGAGTHTFALISGSLPPGVAFSSAGVLSGSPILPGTYTFTLVASDSSGAPGPFTSAPSTYSLTVNAPTLSFTPASLPAGTLASAYSQTFSASGGTGPYAYSVASGGLPPGMSLSSGGVFSGTPILIGNYAFSVTVTDANGFTATNAYTVAITDGRPIATAVSVTVTAGSANNPIAPSLAGGAAISLAVASAPSHGSVSVSGLELLYTPAAGYSGGDSFTYTATNASGTSAAATVTITVRAAVPVAANHTLEILAGTHGTVDLQQGATQGPFASAAIVSVAPASGGTASLSGTTLSFVPAAGFAGIVVVRYTLSNAGGTSAPADVTITVIARPDPSLDPEVVGLINAQTAATRRFAEAQISNFGNRLHSLRDGGAGTAFALQLAKPGRQVDCATTDDAYANTPRNHCQDAEAGQQGQREETVERTNQPSPWAAWIGGIVNEGERDGNASRSGFDFETQGISGGLDYRWNERVAVGVGLGYARDSTDVGSAGSSSEATGWSLVGYGTHRPSPRSYVEMVLGYGKLDFDWRRALDGGGSTRGQRDGDQWFGSATAGYEHRSGGWLWSPYLSLDWARADLDAFTESGGASEQLLAIGDQSVDLLTSGLGLRMEYAMERAWGSFVPYARAEWRHDFHDASSATLSYADWAASPIYRASSDSGDRDYYRLGIGFDLRTRHGFRVGFGYETLLDSANDRDNTFLLRLGDQF